MKQTGRVKALGQIYNLEYWSVRHCERHSEIELISRKNDKWEMIAEIKGPHHKALAVHILSSIKAHTRFSDQLEEAINAVKLCLDGEDLSWEAEQACEVILRKSRQGG